MWGSKKALFRLSRNNTRNYRFLANVERPLRLSGWNYWKNFNFTQTWRYNTKFYEPNEKNGTPLFWVELTFKGCEDAMIFCVLIFIFCLEPTIREQMDENNFRHYYGVFFRKYHSETTWSQLCSKLFCNN